MTLRPKLGRFARRGGKVAVDKRLSVCVPGCLETPKPVMCEKHWPLVSSTTRRALVAEFWACGRPSKRLLELLRLALSEMSGVKS